MAEHTFSIGRYPEPRTFDREPDRELALEALARDGAEIMRRFLDMPTARGEAWLPLAAELWAMRAEALGVAP